jgi:peptidyl-tRNA hydrolase, PTH1 family
MSVRLIVGLGNPGPRYANNRHNVGYQFVDSLAQTYGLASSRQQFHAHVTDGRIAGQRVLLAKPLTFMNLSGNAVGSLMHFYKLTPADLMVIYDDLDLPLGRARLRPGGGSGGHKGMASIIERVGAQEFARLRIGIGRPQSGEPADYVLKNFTVDERIELERTFERAREALVVWMNGDIDQAMNNLNRPSESEGGENR